MSVDVVPSSGSNGVTVDRLSALLERFRVRAALFHSGPLCGTSTFEALPGRASLHVLRRGSMTVRHLAGSGVPRVLRVDEPRCIARRAVRPAAREGVVAVRRSPGDDWTLPRMAHVAAMSRSAFAESFRRATGTTPAAYLTTWRLTLATSMLHAGRPVNVVATDLGFASTSHYREHFASTSAGRRVPGWASRQ